MRTPRPGSHDQLPRGTVTVQHAAHYLDVAPKTVRRWCREGRLEARNPGGGIWLVTMASLQRLVDGEPVKP